MRRPQKHRLTRYYAAIPCGSVLKSQIPGGISKICSGSLHRGIALGGTVGSEIVPIAGSIIAVTIPYVWMQRRLMAYAKAKNLKETERMRQLEREVAQKLRKQIPYMTEEKAISEARYGLETYHTSKEYDELRRQHEKTLEYYRIRACGRRSMINY